MAKEAKKSVAAASINSVAKNISTYAKTASPLVVKCADGAFRRVFLVTRDTKTYDEKGYPKINGAGLHDLAQMNEHYAAHSAKLCCICLAGKLIAGFAINGLFIAL
jgi:hypothetical protein